MNQSVNSSQRATRRLGPRLLSVLVVGGLLLAMSSPVAAAPPSAELQASLAVEVRQSGGSVDITVNAEDLSERTAKVRFWRLSLVEIIPDDGRGGEGGLQVDAVDFASRELPVDHTFVVDARSVDYYVTLEAIGRTNGRNRPASQLLLISERVSVDCTTANVDC